MSLKTLYQSYLANPSAAALSDHASLNYIPTLTTINTAASIVKHNTAHQKVLKKREERIIDCIESSNAITLDVETTLEFMASGGAYLPGLDDNFVADRVVSFPMVHIVRFNSSQQIEQIRLYWDQGSLLKQIDVIGARARNWPIRDGKDQSRLIVSSVANTGQDSGHQQPSAPHNASNESTSTGNPRAQSKNVTGDPHATLSLFSGYDQTEGESQPQVIAPRASAKPPPRDYHDLFAGNHSDASPQGTKGPKGTSPKKENQTLRPSTSKAQSAKPPPRDYHDLFVGNESDQSPIAKDAPPSPSKELFSPPAPKGGAGKNHQPNRLFGNDANEPGNTDSPDKGAYKAHPTKYDHFEFGHGEDAPVRNADRPKSKHSSQWDFEDFHTPLKPSIKVRNQDKRHFGWEEDEANLDSPAKHPAVAKPRPDADPHFEFKDDGSPLAEHRPAGHPRGAGGVKATGLYQDHIFGESSPSGLERNKPLAPITNLSDRRKDFDPHFAMTDSPSADKESSKPISEARQKVVSQMGAQWEASDPPPASAQQLYSEEVAGPKSDKENVSRGIKNVGIKTGGDGMGGKKGQGRSWGFGSESGDEEEAFHAGKKQQAPKGRGTTEAKGFWDF